MSAEPTQTTPTGQAPACGQRVCAWCRPPRDLGAAPALPVGAVTHGMCADCERREFPEHFLPKKS